MNELHQALLKSEGFINLSGIETALKSHDSTKKIDYAVVRDALLQNSSLRVLPEDMQKLGLDIKTHPLSNLIHAKEIAKSRGNNVFIACMPKSGSSFLATSISQGLDYALKSLTSSRRTSPSSYGVNPREQELCELAIMNSILHNQKPHIVAQHHTKASPYTAQILSAYNFQVIVQTRNVFDILVSADDMLKDWNVSNPKYQGAASLPLDFNTLEVKTRYDLLAKGLGIWCINFYVSWLRQRSMGTKFLHVDYNKDIAADIGDKLSLGKKLSDFLSLDEMQSQNLKSLFEKDQIDETQSRFNRGVSNRGLEVPSCVRGYLIDYAKQFSSELDAGDYKRLFGTILN